MTTEAQIRVAEADRRELNERIATEILGWRRSRAEYGEAPWILPDGVTAWTVRYFTTDPTADYEVLRHVRETWEQGMIHRYGEALYRIWRHRSMFMDVGMRYEPGDYSRAALAVMEGE
jgi:hypothetical protein